MSSLGRHILVEFLGCDSRILDDVSIIEKAMVEAATRAGATVINSTFHHFSPLGVSGVVVIQESHLAIHTWPEFQYAAVDLFTCGDTVEPWISFDLLKVAFKAQNHSAIEMYRGNINLLNRTLVEATSVAKSHEKPPIKFSRSLWFTDRDDAQALSLRYVGEPLFNQRSDYQAVRVFETAAYGRMLALDNVIMCTERDEMHYHEVLVHPAMQLVQSAQRVLVIGGGDGGTVREVLRYPTVQSVDLVEIDELVVKASLEYLPKISYQLVNPKVKVHIQDGFEFLKKYEGPSWDLIVVDGADPVGPAEVLFSIEFFQLAKKHLGPRGVFVTQGESPMFNDNHFVEINRRLKKVFSPEAVFVGLFFTPTYPSGMWSVQLACQRPCDPVRDVDYEKIAVFSQHQNLHYYNADVHRAIFSLPNFVSRMLSHN